MYKWKYHQPTPNINHLKNKDLINTNKQALKTGFTGVHETSQSFSKFRKSNTLYKPVKEGTNVIPIKLPEANHFYGKPLEYFFLYLDLRIQFVLLFPILMVKMIKWQDILFMRIKRK